MGDFYTLRKAESLSTLPRYSTAITRSPTSNLQRVRRFHSVPNLTTNDLYLSGKYVPLSRPYSRVWDSDDFYNYYYGTRYNPYSSSYYSYPYSWRRYDFLRPLSWLNDYHYPTSWYSSPRYRWWYDYSDPYYYMPYRSYLYDNDWPWYYPYRSRYYEGLSSRRAVDLYNRGVINYSALNKYWLSPYSWDKTWSNLRDAYIPSGYYGPRRYYYYW